MFATTHLTLFIVVCISILYQRGEAFTAGAGNIADMGKRGFSHDKVTGKSTTHFSKDRNEMHWESRATVGLKALVSPPPSNCFSESYPG